MKSSEQAGKNSIQMSCCFSQVIVYLITIIILHIYNLLYMFKENVQVLQINKPNIQGGNDLIRLDVFCQSSHK